MGPDGLYQVAKTAVLNNNYMFKKLMELPEVTAYYEGRQQPENRTGALFAGDDGKRNRYQHTGYPETHDGFRDALLDLPSPVLSAGADDAGAYRETPSKKDIDEYIETLKYVFKEAHENPDIIKTAPHRSVTHQVDESGMDDPARWATTWKMYLKKYSD